MIVIDSNAQSSSTQNMQSIDNSQDSSGTINLCPTISISTTSTLHVLLRSLSFHFSLFFLHFIPLILFLLSLLRSFPALLKNFFKAAYMLLDCIPGRKSRYNYNHAFLEMCPLQLSVTCLSLTRLITANKHGSSLVLHLCVFRRSFGRPVFSFSQCFAAGAWQEQRATAGKNCGILLVR